MKLALIPILLAVSLPMAHRLRTGTHEAPPAADLTAATVRDVVADTAAIRVAVLQAERQTGGLIGVHVRHLESGETFAARSGEPFFMASVMKLPLAVHVLRQVERGRIRLDDVVRLDSSRLVGGSSAFRRRVSAGTRVTVTELLEAAIRDSDNSAANELLHLVGGPDSVTAELRRMGITGIHLDRDYTRLDAPRERSDTRDTATPEAITNLLAALWNKRLIGAEETRRLVGWMTVSRNPANRIPAGVPPSTPVAHKTGTWMRSGASGAAAVNDVGVITLPGGRGRLAVAVFVRDARLADEAVEPFIAQITRAIYAHCANTTAVAQADDPLTRPYYAEACPSCAEWNQLQAPVRIHGNTYYVGTHGLAAVLITSPEGHVLIDGALPNSAPLILQNIRALGFDPADIRLILNSHAHFDHSGGIAALQRASGARVAASGPSAPVLERGNSGEDDPQHGVLLDFPAVANVQRFADDETLRVGAIAVTAHLTAGHTPGGTTWTWRSCDDAGCVDMVYADSQTPVSADGFRYSDSRAYPTAVADFERGYRTLEALPCDILITPHPAASQLWERLARGPGALVDPMACKRYAANARQQLQRRLESERGQ
ncbi:MAG TPA: subclass B3 metallo-beta-lactamase [Longimicrobium sp.]|jgi:metallo-beta-lactamase class B|nr:subclass B3 metallo-beta-lactamase [Longimicrobium sp.]